MDLDGALLYVREVQERGAQHRTRCSARSRALRRCPGNSGMVGASLDHEHSGPYRPGARKI
jgi:hypothetical protein